MGTLISLSVEGIDLDYAKNQMGNDYGFFFQNGDESRRRLDGIDYAYYEECPNEEDLAGHEAVFARTLDHILPRLKLLGSTLESARAEYQKLISEESEATDNEFCESNNFLTFEEFCLLACRYPLSELNKEYVDYGVVDREKIALGRYAHCSSELDRLPQGWNGGLFWSEASFFSARICILSAPSMLHVLGLNPQNSDADVVWEFGPLVHSGWESRDSFQPGANRGQTILVATEGASDARILKHALKLIRPDVADFFRFIAGDERHHFWGTGNLVKFAEGLLRIDIQNKILFLFDNDAEGVDAHRKLMQLNLPRNMRSMLLPDLEELREFPARGPEGVNICDINGRAAAIECYLDLNLNGYPPAQVLWSNYKKDIDAWHGALEYKETYTRHFFEATIGGIAEYQTTKLSKLLDALIVEASRLSVFE